MNPLTLDELNAIPLARATKVTYPWQGKTHTVWIGEAPHFGWSIITDYGTPGTESVVTSPHNREDCISALVPYMDNRGAMAVEWETITKTHNGWINYIRSQGAVHWAPLPQ